MYNFIIKRFSGSCQAPELWIILPFLIKAFCSPQNCRRESQENQSNLLLTLFKPIVGPWGATDVRQSVQNVVIEETTIVWYP